MPELHHGQHWSHLDSHQRLSLEDFLALIQEYCAPISLAQANLQRTCSLLRENSNVSRDQCNYIIDLAHTLDTPVQALSHLLEQKICLPSAILLLRHQLTIKLLTIKDLLWMILALAGSLRSSRCSDPREHILIQRKMAQKLDTLAQETDTIALYPQILSDQVSFHEARKKAFADEIDCINAQKYDKSQNCTIYDLSSYLGK